MRPNEVRTFNCIFYNDVFAKLANCMDLYFFIFYCRIVAATAEQRRIKPGREIITFLLVSNLAMWLINALEKSRGNSHPYLLHFYGVWAWTIITRISMPLAIFYRQAIDLSMFILFAILESKLPIIILNYKNISGFTAPFAFVRSGRKHTK